MLMPDQMRQIADIADALGKIDMGDGKDTIVVTSPISVEMDGEVLGWLYDEVGAGPWWFTTEGPDTAALDS